MKAPTCAVWGCFDEPRFRLKRSRGLFLCAKHSAALNERQSMRFKPEVLSGFTLSQISVLANDLGFQILVQLEIRNGENHVETTQAV